MSKTFYLPTNTLIENSPFTRRILHPKKKKRKKEAVIITNNNLSFQSLNKHVHEFISDHLMHFPLKQTHIFNTRNSIDIILNTPKSNMAIVNLRKVNDYRRINKFFEEVNNKLIINGLFINSVETHNVRKERILKKIPSPFKLIYYILDFIFHRIFPKVKFIRQLYFNKTKGYGRVLTKAEILGRLYSSGFEVIEDKIINGKLYFIAKKVKEPYYDNEATYGPLIYLKRIGKGGKIIKVAKIRTMHPYAEYLQQYVFNKNNLKEGGKIKNDFRISKIGKLFRKYWIDELPMLINLIRGEIKLIGVRPLSKHYFDLYPDLLRNKRTLYKPGLLPPFYADMPKTLHEITESEMKYLTAYEKSPVLTDIKYLMKILENIMWRGQRSA